MTSRSNQLPSKSVSAAQVDFIEANVRMELAMHQRDTAQASYQTARQRFDEAWDRMTAEEQDGVNAGFRALNEPETVR